MINNLKDFKNSTKRIQSILQTFEIKTPEAFRLSNSASLNFMARILGYENYNTIKAVLEKNILKGNKMKIIKTSKNNYLMLKYLESFYIDNCYDFSNINKYALNIYFNGSEIPLEFKFKTIDEAEKLLTIFKEFTQNNEVELNLESHYNKISNTDNRTNQINPNNLNT